MFKITIEEIKEFTLETIPAEYVYQKIHDRLPGEMLYEVKEYDYVANPNKQITLTKDYSSKKIFEQTIEGLNIASLVSVINGLD